MNADGRGLENVTALLFTATLDHALVRPLVEQAEFWEAVPEKEIQALSAGIGVDPVLAAECRRLFVAECRLSSEPHGALAAWLGFALALAQEPQAADAFSNLVRGFRNPACKEEIEHEHYWLALNCLQLYGEALARQVAAAFPFPDDKLSDEDLIWDDLELLLTVHGSADAELRRQVAAEAERLLNHPEFARECVEVA